jgi:DegV family protein with EDD domain
LATRERICRVVIDSCCDLPADLVESFDVEMLPFNYVMDDGEHLDDLWKSMTPHEFYERLRKGEQSQTSQIPIHVLVESLIRAATSELPTVYICFSSKLSGTFDALVATWETLKADYPDAEVHLVDTKLASAAEGLLVMGALRQCDRGLSAQELAAWVREARYYVHGYFTIDSLETLRRGGRIPDMAAIAGAKLDIKPILTFDLDGRLAFFGAARGRKKSTRQLIRIFEERFPASESSIMIVAGTDCEKEQKALVDHLLNISGELSLWKVDVGPVIGSHVGPGMLALVFWGPDRRERISITDRIANAVTGRFREDT